MNLLKSILVFLILLNTSHLFGQTQGISDIKFKLQHSKRLSNSRVSVNFEKRGTTVKVNVKSLPMDTLSAEWMKTKKEYSFDISLDSFNKLVAAIQKINSSDMLKQVGFGGMDGNTCEIEMGDFQSGITYRIWSPRYDTEQRLLQSYLNACKLILSTAKLDPKEIL